MAPQRFLPLILLCVVMAMCSHVQAQQPRPAFTILKTDTPIILDGVVDEPAWGTAQVISELRQQFPYDTLPAKARTEFRLTYDDEFLYVSAKAYDNVKGGYVISSLRRDFRGPGLDGVSVVIDPFQDLTNGFFFGLSPAGVQREGLIANGFLVNADLDLSWDNKWYSGTRIYEDHWVAEFAIPFKTLRFKAGAKAWNIKLYRIDSKENERAIWPWTPRFFEPGNLNFTGEMNWDQPLQSPGSNISIIPYSAARTSRNFQNDEPRKDKVQVGGDAKLAITSSLNLDLTVNPDFSQVEVDRQVTNLDRFEIFFPERRQFFLENADLFASFGHLRARPFFSRRLGITRDANTGQNIQNKIHFGARLSGNINKLWRIGFLNMQTAADTQAQTPSFNNTVGTLQRRVGTNSNIRAIVVNQQVFANDTLDFKLSGYKYNRVAGVDYNYNFLNNKWTGNVFLHKQFSESEAAGQFAHGFSVVHATRTLNYTWYHQVIGKGYSPALGYVPRNGYKRISPSATYFFYPDSKLINNHGPLADLSVVWDDTYGYTDHEHTFGYQVVFQNQATLAAGVKDFYTYLFRDFDPTNSPAEDLAVKLPQGSDFSYRYGQVNFISNPRNPFNFEFTGIAGTYFNGTRKSVSGLFNYRIQPYGVLSLDMSYNQIRLPAPYRSADIYLAGPRFDLTLTRSVFFTTYFQYNSQYRNVNINSRFQWRFKPVSDLFIVYTDNYYYTFETASQYSNFTPKNRALVLKLTYWFNV
ncbi:MAG: carbohydrate binding family 9 domain-containing protein [Cyclobacteriaceae bacterium]|nr:carbohydrate binding family 9 domain-containing protein [Cyclobacteriaceae bacterium]